MKNIAVVMGGFSAEKVISLKSGKVALNFLDKDKYNAFAVIIDNESWRLEKNGKLYPINKSDFSVDIDNQKIKFDGVFMAIHGTPGEDGKLQGYLDMIGIPYNTSSAAISALTFQKFHCNQFLKNFGINVAEAVLIKAEEQPNIDELIDKVALPCFVKPTDGGSSFGVTKVKSKEGLIPAINAAFGHGTEVVVEEFIEGRELTNGVYRDNEGIKALPITEIISENEFFDYEAKYNGQSKEVTPAEISNELTKKIKALTIHIYSTLGMKGIARVDYIVDSNDKPFVIEINSVPGMSKESIIPQMIKFNLIDLKRFLNSIIKL